jgi:hypothetical protein
LDLSQYVPQEFAAAVEMRLFFIHAAQVMTEIQAAVAKNERARTWYNQNLKGLESCTPYFHLVTPQVTEEEIGCRAVLANMSDTLEVLGQGTQNPNPFPLLIQQLSLKEEYIDWADHAEGPNSSLGSWDQGQLFYSALLKVADPESSDDTPFMGRLYFMAAPWVIRNYLDGSLSPSEASIISRATDVYSAGRLPESARTLGDWMEMYFKKKLDP